MTQEEKAQRYDEAIKVAKSKIRNDKDHVLYEDDVMEIFPELAESEDERIKRVIKLVLDESTTEKDECYLDNGVTQQEVLAWLEKQGKNNMGISEATKQELEDSLNKALEKETPESFNEFLDEQGEQKQEPLTKEKALKNSPFVEQKQEWSEEDIMRINNLIAIIENRGYPDYVEYLEKLKYRLHWNPSNEQIDALEDAIADAVSSIQKNMLNSLYNDLKKLKGE